MRQHLFKLLLLSLLCAAWPGRVGAETLGWVTLKESRTEQLTEEYRKTTKSAKWKKERTERHKSLLQQWEGKGGYQGWLISALVLLSIITLFLAFFWVGLVIVFISYGSWEFSVILLLLFGIGVITLCVWGIVRIARKLRKQKQRQRLPEDLPHRLPSKPMNKQ